MGMLPCLITQGIGKKQTLFQIRGIAPNLIGFSCYIFDV